jgi:hypothetical protein
VQNISRDFAMDELNIKLADVRNLNERISNLSKQKEVKFTPQILSNKLDPLLQCASQFVQNNFEEMIDNNIKNIINISPQFPFRRGFYVLRK